jgi:ketosteroid isomerase-like protein
VSAENEVRRASAAFYAALNRMINGDAGALADVWSHSADVTTMHPIGARQVGWDAVRDSFGNVAAIASDGAVRMDEQLIRVVGDLAYELGVERGRARLAEAWVDLDQRVTNIYRRETGGWKIVHHHTDPSPGMLKVVERLQAGK